MAGRLSDAGHDVVVWSRTRAHAEALAGRAQVAGSPADAGSKADVAGIIYAAMHMEIPPQAYRTCVEPTARSRSAAAGRQSDRPSIARQPAPYRAR